METLAELRLLAKVEALNHEATESQMQNLVAWTIENLPRDSWQWAADEAMSVEGFYTEISMRLGEHAA